MTAAHLHAHGLSVSFGGTRVLDDVDLLAQGGLVAVLGANGAGKTTLLRCLATVIEPSAGSLRIDGLDPNIETERIEARRRLGYMPQDPGFHPDATVFDALDYFAVLKEHRDERRRRRSVFDALDRVGMVGRAADRIGALSGGMRRRLALAQALLGSPTLLVLDEPGAGLDPDERLRLRGILADRRRTTTVVVSTHLTDEAAICDTVVVLAAGALRFNGPPSRLADLAAGRAWVQRALPAPDVRASWQLADGRFRCLGAVPPADAEPAAPTIEDGYLLVLDTARAPAT